MKELSDIQVTATALRTIQVSDSRHDAPNSRDVPQTRTGRLPFIDVVRALRIDFLLRVRK